MALKDGQSPQSQNLLFLNHTQTPNHPTILASSPQHVFIFIQSSTANTTNMSTFNSRFIIWLWLTVLTMYMIITNSIADDPELIILSQKYCMDNIFCMILGALTGLSFGTWVKDGGESSPAILSNKLPTNNLGGQHCTEDQNYG